MARSNDPITSLLRNVFQQAPQILHHIFALDGANETLALLQNEESKVAYLLQMIALELHKAGKEIDSTKVSSGPDDIKFHAVRTDKFFPSVPFDITILDLGDFEDLYYATCAKLKELFHGVDVHLTNGFKSTFDTYFMYHCPRLDKLDPVNVGDFKASLLVYEEILYSSELTDALNKGIIKKSMRHNKHDIQKHLSRAQPATHDSSCKRTEEHFKLRHMVFQNNLGWLTGIGSLQDMRNMSCGMIYASLSEKYRPTVISNESLGSSISRQSTPDVPQAVREAKVHDVYISPYNLEERAKKLNAPGGPEMPCICDPDCICAPVCASDLTLNCLCEENSLFARVTQGMDIDDLDVPDLVRRDRQGSETSRSSVFSKLSDVDTFPESPTDPTYYSPIDDAFADRYTAASEVRKQQRDQQHQLRTKMEAADPVTTPEIPASPKLRVSEFWQSQNVTPPRISSLAYRDALLQPFAKQCDYPPKRSSIAQRLFFSRSNCVGVGRKAPNEAAGKVLKQTNKRSFAEMSFTGLRLALRRDPQTGATAEKN